MSSLLFGNDTDIVHWKPNPNSRGTFNILTTCLITLLLCVWTAVHLNISPPGSFWRPFLRKVGWLILALLAPEVVAYTAWYSVLHDSLIRHELIVSRCQRKEALKIMRMVNDAYGRPNPTPWYTTALQSMKNGTAKLGRSLRWQTPKPLRVSRGIRRSIRELTKIYP